MNRRRIAVAALFVGMLTLAPIAGHSAVPQHKCNAGPVQVVGWGGSRFVPIPPQGIGASCEFFTAGAQFIRGIAQSTAVLTGGIQIILPDGRRFYCRDSITETPFVLAGTSFGQQHPDALCTYYVIAMKVEIYLILPAPVVGNIYCSTTGEVGLNVEILCGEAS